MSAPQTPTTVQFIQAQPFILAGAGSSIGDTTILLQSFTGIDGTNIVTGDLGSFAYGTLEPGNGTNEEAVLFTGVTQNANGTATLTGVSSVSFKQPYTVTTGLTKTHVGASKFIISNDAAFYNNFTLYLNSIAGAGAANASTTVKGIVQAATTSQINSGTATGSTGAILAVTPDALAASNYAIASGTVNALAGSNGTPSATNKFVTQQGLKFGGTGSDGALALSSGTTTINLSSAATVTKNYTSISITGSGRLAFSNPSANGTLVVLKSQGNITFSTASATSIDISGLGAATGSVARSNLVLSTPAGSTNTPGTAPSAGGLITPVKNVILACGGAGGAGTSGNNSSNDGIGGAGGSTLVTTGPVGVNAGSNTPGSGTPGIGGRGGGGLYIECAGTYTNTNSIIYASGATGGVATGTAAGGGGGGGGGSIVALYNTLSSDTGVYSVPGGPGGAGVSGFTPSNGSAGASGFAIVSLNNDFV